MSLTLPSIYFSVSCAVTFNEGELKINYDNQNGKRISNILKVSEFLNNIFLVNVFIVLLTS